MTCGVAQECGGAEGIPALLDFHGEPPLDFHGEPPPSGASPVGLQLWQGSRWDQTAAALPYTRVLLPSLLPAPHPLSSKPVDSL